MEPRDNPGFSRKKEKDKRPDKFIWETGQFFGMKTDELVKLWNHGYGRNELIKILLMSRYSKKDLNEIVKLRDKNTKLAKIAEKYGLDYEKILDEAAKVRSDIDFRVERSTYTVAVSTVTEKKK